MRRGINNISEMLSEIRAALLEEGEKNQWEALSHLYYKIDATSFGVLDPFKQPYKEQILSIYEYISKNNGYDPFCMERTNSLDAFDTAQFPLPYRLSDSRLVGEFLSCYGWILKTLDVRAGADVLEYGSGEGQLSIQLARMGCNVHAIDIENRFLESIQRQCKALGLNIVTQIGRFGDGINDKQFDRVIFFEAFHHCLDHQDALLRIRRLLKPDGFICFSGEPIIADKSLRQEILPYPWGLRLDGDAVRSIAEFGWMELGYSEEYFIELLGRCGFSVEIEKCPGFWRGDVYIGRPFGTRYPIERNTLLGLYDGRSGWYTSEGTHRWTNGDAWFPVPNLGYRNASITVANLGPKQVEVHLSCGGNIVRHHVESGREVILEIALPECGEHIRIKSETFFPSISFSNEDTRMLGVAVKAIEFLL